MSADHEALLADLRVLAETVLDRVEAAVQQLAVPEGAVPDTGMPGPEKSRATTDSETDPGSAAAGGCSWCPLCAVAALLRGENHELINRLAAQLAALIAVIRELLARYLPAPPPGPGDAGGPTPEPPDRGGGFVPIPVTIRP